MRNVALCDMPYFLLKACDIPHLYKKQSLFLLLKTVNLMKAVKVQKKV